MNVASNSSNLSFEFSDDSKAEIQNIFRDLAKQAVSEVMQSPVERKMFLNKSEAQAYIGVSYATLQKLIAQGLPVIQIDGKILLSKVSINEFLKSIEK
ncbi:MAG: helix-turn-helix domain-containing protein [Trichococcus flocculiformis]|uniref:Helix-turn-helix domain-containing protein n=1 Tax=Trichococcus flocculiformis TaxID=82803 RepID=A0A847D630_9LACT|nr:helix-turn-helix domain-containing protein [Trichococcus flocculiformis]NLD32279.1 helix-turn-helix domain-containing protein [Trichococcus flocculiformis]